MPQTLLRENGGLWQSCHLESVFSTDGQKHAQLSQHPALQRATLQQWVPRETRRWGPGLHGLGSSRSHRPAAGKAGHPPKAMKKQMKAGPVSRSDERSQGLIARFVLSKEALQRARVSRQRGLLNSSRKCLDLCHRLVGHG